MQRLMRKTSFVDNTASSSAASAAKLTNQNEALLSVPCFHSTKPFFHTFPISQVAMAKHSQQGSQFTTPVTGLTKEGGRR